MSKMVELNLKPDEKILRQFGWISLVGFAGLAALAFYERLIFAFGLGDARLTVATTLACLGGVSALLSLIAPKGNLPLYVGLTLLSYPIGFVMSYLIMGLLYFGMFAPLAIVFRIVGRDSMQRTFDPSAKSYWVPSRPERPRESYFRQF